jgi:glycosyltransferase involved in cell wall biosynthesis
MLTSDYLPGFGGIATHIYQLSGSLQKLGCQVEIWYWDRQGKIPDVGSMGDIPVRILKGGKEGVGSIGQSGHLAESIGTEYARFRPDVLHIHTMDALLLASRRLGRDITVKIVWTNHTSRFLRKCGSWLWRQKMRFECAAVDGLITASRDRMDASRFLPIASKLNVANGVDVVAFEHGDRQQSRCQLGIDDEQFVMLYTGRFAPVKGVVYLAQALAQLHQSGQRFLCIFCGNIDGDRESAKVREIIENSGAGDCVRFEGFVPNSEIEPYLAACNVLVLPSLMEATSISGLEAMAASRAIVGTRIGGITELVEERLSGFLVEPKNADQLCEVLREAMGREDLDFMGQRGHQRVLDQYTWMHTAEEVFSFYRHLLDADA